MANQTYMVPIPPTPIITPVAPVAPAVWCNTSYREGFFTGAFVTVVVSIGISAFTILHIVKSI
jgi:hypothetical protein